MLPRHQIPKFDVHVDWLFDALGGKLVGDVADGGGVIVGCFLQHEILEISCFLVHGKVIVLIIGRVDMLEFSPAMDHLNSSLVVDRFLLEDEQILFLQIIILQQFVILVLNIIAIFLIGGLGHFLQLSCPPHAAQKSYILAQSSLLLYYYNKIIH